MTKERLVKHYEQKLENVKESFCNTNTISLSEDMNKEYVEYAEKELEAVKNGRNW